MGCESSDVVRFVPGPLLHGQTRITELFFFLKIYTFNSSMTSQVYFKDSYNPSVGQVMRLVILIN